MEWLGGHHIEVLLAQVSKACSGEQATSNSIATGSVTGRPVLFARWCSRRRAGTGPPLPPLIWRSMPDLGPSFRQFADGLKERAER
jgi:hypothetical protein